MAIVKGPIKMTGSISGLSFYTRRGSDEVIVRTKGGISGDKIKRLPQFDGLRKQQKEWSGTNKLVSGFRMALGGLHRLADYNITPTLNSLANKMQKADNSFEKGKRPVCLSAYKHTVEGFNLNRNYLFNAVVRTSVSFELNREELSATVNFPRINPDMDLLNVQRLPYFRLIIALGTVSDMVYNESLNDYSPKVLGLHGAALIEGSEWYPTAGIMEALQLTTRMSNAQCSMLTEDVSVLLSVAIEFGTVGFDGQPAAVKYAGCSKVMAVK